MIIISQVEPIVEPILENEFWYLPTRASRSARAASMISLIESTTSSTNNILLQRKSNERTQIPPFEYDNRYLQFFGLPKFQPKELKIKIDLERHLVIINGQHKYQTEWEFDSCEFTKRILIPNNVDIKNMKCFLGENGLIQIEAPIINKNVSVEQQQPKEEKFIKIQHEKQESSNISNPKTLTTTIGQNIPIEFVNDNKNFDNVDGKQPINEESFSLKHHEQLERSSKRQITTIERKSKNTTTTPTPTISTQPFDQVRQMIYEVPIRMARRPIDQGVLCPCCCGRGSRSLSSDQDDNDHNHQYQNYPQLIAYRNVSTDSNQKKDYQPKNLQQQSTILSSNVLNQAISELQKVATIESRDNQLKK